MALILSDEQVRELGGGLRAPVTVTIGGVRVRVRLARMGGKNMIGFRKELREQLGITAGDWVDALIELDTEERTVDLPVELAAALDAEGLRSTFEALAYSHRREHARSVAEAKREDTKQRRVAAVLAALRR